MRGAKQETPVHLPRFLRQTRSRGLIGLFMVIMLGSVTPAQALFCHGAVVSEGASKPEVLHKCGNPTFAEQRLVSETIYVYPNVYQVPRPHEVPRTPLSPPPTHRRGQQSLGPSAVPRHPAPGPVLPLYPPQPVVITELVEEWTYNFGPHSFMYRLRFADGVLRSITTLNYGY